MPDGVVTWADLTADVRAQVDVDDLTALGWLVDCAPIMNAEAGWNLNVSTYTGDGNENAFTTYPCVRIEAVLVDNQPYRRRTLSQMDAAVAGGSSRQIYTELAGAFPAVLVNPTPRSGGAIEVRWIEDVAYPDDPTTQTPGFPSDLVSCLADGAIATGLARMDERFDSAGYFQARFTDATTRLKHRRNSRVGRGPVPIRLVT